jgi:anti-sigma28 factor (negative regulator of flagellin synthesis)
MDAQVYSGILNGQTPSEVMNDTAAKPSTGTPDSEQLSGDTANLSQISSLVAKAIEQPEIRKDKVDATKAQTAAGTYEVNPSKPLMR